MNELLICNRKSRWLLPSRVLVLGLALGLAGCSGKSELDISKYPVKGRVLLANGKPLTSGRVYFHRVDEPPIRATGQIKSDGSFELMTEAEGDGAPAGKYRVQIDPTPVNLSGRAVKTKLPRIPAKYRDEDGEGLTVNVQVGSNDLEPFRLK